MINGELPSVKQKEEFVSGVTYHTMLHEKLNEYFRGFRRDSHPMAIMCGVFGGLSAFYHHDVDIHDSDHRKLTFYRLIGEIPTMAMSRSLLKKARQASLVDHAMRPF